MGRRKSKAAKKARAGQIGSQEDEYKGAPHTFIFHRGHIGKNVTELLHNMRQVMEPYTASKLKARKANVLKDFVSVAGMMNVSHFVIFTKTEAGTNMRITRLPRGPTLTFKVSSYCLARDVVSSLKRPNMDSKQFKHHPLLVMNNFSGEGMHMKLMATMFQNMFPSININKLKLDNIRRCVLLNYNQEENSIDFRHYNVKVVPVGLTRGVKKLIKAKIPNLGKFDDIADYFVRGGDASESEAEPDGPHNEVVLPQKMASRGNMKDSKSAIRLTEIGPRMTLQLVKIEEGLCSGAVLYHAHVEKTEEELKAIKEMREQKRILKDKRKQQQAQNVKKKQEKKEELKKKSLAGMKRAAQEDSDAEDPGHEEVADKDESESEDDDVKYYQEEVGEMPDPDLFPSTSKTQTAKKKKRDTPPVPLKKRKLNKDTDKKKKDSSKGDMLMKKMQKKKRRPGVNTKPGLKGKKKRGQKRRKK